MYYLGSDIGFVDDEWMEQAAEESSRHFREMEREERRRRSRDPPKNATVKALQSLLKNASTEDVRKKRVAIISNAPTKDLKYIDSEGRTLLFTLGTYGDSLLNEMRALISREAIDINHRSANGSTALHQYARRGPLEVVKLLVDSGADMNVRNNEGVTPAMCDMTDEIAHFFADKAAEMNQNGERRCDLSLADNRRFTACTCAVIREEHVIARAFARASHRFDGQALATAIYEGKMRSVVDVLLSRNDVDLEQLIAEPDYTGMQQTSTNQKIIKLIDYVSKKNFLDIVARAVPEVKKAYAGLFLSDALLNAVQELDAEKVSQTLVEGYDVCEETINAIKNAFAAKLSAGNKSAKEKRSADTNASQQKPQRGPLAAWSTRPPPYKGYEPDINRRPSGTQRTIVHALLRAIQSHKSKGRPSDHRAIVDKGAFILRLLLAAGADPNGCNTDDLKNENKLGAELKSRSVDEDQDKWFVKGDRINPDGISESYPVMLATRFGLPECVRIIATSPKYDRLLRPADGKGPLPVAYALICWRPDIAKILLTEVVGGSPVDGGSDDALEVLGRLHEVRDEHYIMTLDDDEAKHFVKNLPKDYLEIARLILQQSTLVDTPIIRGSWEVNKMILANGNGGVSARGPVYRTQLMRLVWAAPLEMKREDALKSIQLLIDHGADINAQDDDGITALAAAAAAEWPEAVELLLKEGADAFVTTIDGLSILEEIEAKAERKYPGMRLFETMWVPKNRRIIELLDPSHALLKALGSASKKTNLKATASQKDLRVRYTSLEPDYLNRNPKSYNDAPSRMTRFSGVLPCNCGIRHDDPEGDFERAPYDRSHTRAALLARLANGELEPRTCHLRHMGRNTRENVEDTVGNCSSSATSRKPTSVRDKQSRRGRGGQERTWGRGRGNEGRSRGRRNTGGTIYDFGHGEVEYYSDGNDPYAEFDDYSMPSGFLGRRHVSSRPDPSQPLSLYTSGARNDFFDTTDEDNYFEEMDPYLTAALLSGGMPFRGGDDDDFFALYGLAAMGIDPSSYLESMRARDSTSTSRRGSRGRGRRNANNMSRGNRGRGKY